jgi:hypothetical protein
MYLYYIYTVFAHTYVYGTSTRELFAMDLVRLLWHQDLGATSVEALEAMLSRVKQCLGQDDKGVEKDQS